MDSQVVVASETQQCAVADANAAGGVQITPYGTVWKHPYPMPTTWVSNANAPREIVAFDAGMTTHPFEPCSSMRTCMPHASGLVLINMMKRVYFFHRGGASQAPFRHSHSWTDGLVGA